MTPLAYLLAAGVGLVLGALGGGGSILAVPILVYALGTDPKIAIAMSLPIVGFTSLAGAWGHWRAGNLQVRPALIFGIAAMLGAFTGTQLAGLISGRIQLAALAVVMGAAALSMLAPKRTRADAPAGSRRASVALSIVTGLLIGVLTGLLGVGGGFLFVPALVLFARLPMKQAIGTSLLVIAMSSTAGVLGYMGHVPVDWTVVIRFTTAAIVGLTAGVCLVRFLPHQSLRRAFGVFLLVVAGWMLIQNLRASGDARHRAVMLATEEGLT